MTDTVLAAKADSFRFFIETVSQSMQSQQHIAMYGIAVLLAIFGALLVGNWFTSNRQYKTALEGALTAIRKEMQAAVESRVKDEVAQAEGTLAATLQRRLDRIDVQISGLLGMTAVSRDDYRAAVVYTASAIESCAKAGIDKAARGVVDGLVCLLMLCSCLDKDTKKKVRDCLKHIPAILDREKKAIEERLAALPDEAPPEQTATPE